MAGDAKKTILLRRARFVAAAMAGLAGPACGKTTAPPENQVQPPPQPCLSPMPTDASTPAPCLTFAPPPPPPPEAGAPTKK
jgi:hypothetical protein